MLGSYESVNPLSDEQHCGWDGNITSDLISHSAFLGARREGTCHQEVKLWATPWQEERRES